MVTAVLSIQFVSPDFASELSKHLELSKMLGGDRVAWWSEEFCLCSEPFSDTASLTYKGTYGWMNMH